MFTGLIQGIGTIAETRSAGQSRQLGLRSAPLAAELEIGDSIAVDGVCLTVVSKSTDVFLADVSSESLSRTTLGTKGPGDRVNLEPALRLGDRLGGHLVTGHVDGLGRVVERRRESNGTVFSVAAGVDLMPLIVEKGSIAIDGISLTVNHVGKEDFSVMIIPHTLENTTLCDRRPGHQLNLETDLLGKYVARLLPHRTDRDHGTVDLETLARNGFL
ncbi:MAG: riboflavin synthase [Acidobacteriota bacterium]